MTKRDNFKETIEKIINLIAPKLLVPWYCTHMEWQPLS